MILNDEQNERFFDTMDSLLYFVNERFRVVEDFTLNYDNLLGDVKASLVNQALWENVEIIDEFVRENPYHLPQRCLDVALGWRNALPGLYALVRYQGGCAVLMGEAGVFSVSGVTFELEQEIGPAPAYVQTVLLPFDDRIVYDGFIQSYDTNGKADQLGIQDEFENRIAQSGIATTANEFNARARAFLDAKHDAELEALLSGAAVEAELGEEQLPQGFHRGVLAGLSADERRERVGWTPLSRSDEALHPTVDDATWRRWNQALDCLDACVILCGLVSVDDAYAQYCSLVSDVVERTVFDQLIGEMALTPEVDFGTWEFDGARYVVHYTLTPDFVAHEHMRAQRQKITGVYQNPETGEVTFGMSGAAAEAVRSNAAYGTYDGADLPTELQWLEQYKRELITSQSNLAMKPLSRTLLENDVMSELLDNPNVVRLRDFLDERIPDGQNDLTFADDAVYEMVLGVIESGSMQALSAYASSLGLDGCSSNPEQLNKLLANMFNSMPSWDNNGWSPQELYEQLTGRKLFYNKDGSVVRVGADDSCPCGSGKKYRDCCGR